MKKPFRDFFTEQIRDEDNKKLLERMTALETVNDEGPENTRRGK